MDWETVQMLVALAFGTPIACGLGILVTVFGGIGGFLGFVWVVEKIDLLLTKWRRRR